MGVSPNTFEGQNRMPRPGTRSRSPERHVPFEDQSLAGSYAKFMPEKRIIDKESVQKAHFPESIAASVSQNSKMKTEKMSSSKEKTSKSKKTTTK